MMQTPIVAMVWEGLDAVATIRNIIGITKGREAELGSVRGDLAMSGANNLIHASDSEENATKEKQMLFGENEIFEYVSALDFLVYSDDERA